MNDLGAETVCRETDEKMTEALKFFKRMWRAKCRDN